MKKINSIKFGALLCLGLLSSQPWLAQAAGFEIGISPSRAELQGQSGQRIGQSINVHNVGSSSTKVSLRTIDWQLVNDRLSYHDELLPGSCRPWVRLERPNLTIPARAKSTFRYEINIPANAPRGECHFMIAVEGMEPATQAALGGKGANMSVPVTGRVAATVYLAVNGAAPALNIQKMQTANMQGKRVPAILVQNSGDAHGRMNGVLDAVDARGQSFQLEATGAPVMPGQTQTVLLAPIGEQSRIPMTFPVNVKGLLEWGEQGIKVEHQFK